MAESKKSWLSGVADKMGSKKKSGSPSSSEPPVEEGAVGAKHESKRSKILKIANRIWYLINAVIAAILVIVLFVLLPTQLFVIELVPGADSHHGRFGGAVTLIVLVVIALVTLIVGAIVIHKKKKKSNNVVAAVLIGLAIVEALVVGITIAPKKSDDTDLKVAIDKSFANNKAGMQLDKLQWDVIQKTQNCCGVHSPEDYRDLQATHSNNFPPMLPPPIPVSCCPGYNVTLADNDQEQLEGRCRFRREYYKNGCQVELLKIAEVTPSGVLHITICLIVFELLSAIPLLIAGSKKHKKHPHHKPAPAPPQEAAPKASEAK